MATSVILPKQGQSVEACIITQWYKNRGDGVEIGDLLFAYETDKSSFEEEAQVEGILLDVFFEEGDEVPVLSEVAVIGKEGEKIEKPQDSGSEHVEVAEAEEAGGGADAVTAEAAKTESGKDADTGKASGFPDRSGDKMRISPRARKMAESMGIELIGLAGSGPNGRIIVRDIESAGERVKEAAAEPVPVSEPAVVPEPATASEPVTGGEWEDRPLTNMRKLISKAMHVSLQNSAQLTHHLGADARSILSLRKKVKKLNEQGRTGNITLNDMICFAVVRALKKHPDAGVHFLGESIRHFRNVHLGIAVDTDRGLMVPVLRNADELTLAGLSARIFQLAAACRSGKIDPDLLQPEAATFTVSNLGNYGVEMFTPVINLPQAAILGVNTILERPARMEDGTLGFLPYLGLSLTYDHRALDGGPATLFLAEIKKEIEQFSHELINQ
jgi:pyruvate dehydrogenase E2 component (dihydrolipoamide acetyltransferase)